MRLAVVAGVLINANKKILVAERPEGKVCAGLWEFPGGKIESGESQLQALKREIQEELNLVVEQASFLFTHVNTFPDRIVDLHVWKVSAWSGDVKGMENQAYDWLTLEQIDKIKFLPGNRAMLPELAAHI